MTLKTSDKAKINHSLKGHFLLAMPCLEAGIFAKSITYLIEHGEEGAMGLIINRPLDLAVTEIFDQLEIKSSASLNSIPIMASGPVQMDHGFVLHRDKVSNWEACIEVSDEVLLTTSRDILFSIAEDQGPKETLIALGYAGWSPGQLEEELAKNSWLTMPADSDIIFSTPYDQRFSQAAAQIGVDMNLISAQVGHA